jgi:hypothetical protein
VGPEEPHRRSGGASRTVVTNAACISERSAKGRSRHAPSATQGERSYSDPNLSMNPSRSRLDASSTVFSSAPLPPSLPSLNLFRAEDVGAASAVALVGRPSSLAPTIWKRRLRRMAATLAAVMPLRALSAPLRGTRRRTRAPPRYDAGGADDEVSVGGEVHLRGCMDAGGRAGPEAPCLAPPGTGSGIETTSAARLGSTRDAAGSTRLPPRRSGS